MLRGDHWVSSRFPSLVSIPSFGVAIWGPGRGMEFSIPKPDRTTTREMDNLKMAIWLFRGVATVAKILHAATDDRLPGKQRQQLC